MKTNIPLNLLLEALGDTVISCDLDQSIIIDNIASLEKAGPGDLAIILDRGDASVFDQVDRDSIKKSRAGVLLAHEALVADKKYIIVKDVLAAFAKLARFIDQYQDKQQDIQQTSREGVTVHESAVISPGVTIGAGTIIGAQVFVGKHCSIGKNVILYPGAKILNHSMIGDNTIIHAGAIIGSDGFGYQVTKTGLKKIPQVGLVRIGNMVEIGANCMIDRASFDETIIGDCVKMDNSIHIAHNVKIGAYTAILAQTGIAGSVEIGAGCQIGGQVAIKDHVKIGNGVKIVSNSAVMGDIKDGEVVAGFPAIPFSQWKRLVVSLNKVPEALKFLSNFQNKQEAKKTSWWYRLCSLVSYKK